MPTQEEDLKFKTHLKSYEEFLVQDEDQNIYWHHQAQENHMLVVTNGILKCQLELMILGQKVPKGESYNFLIYGVLRRTQIIWNALRKLHSVVPPDRSIPLEQPETTESAQALNDIYLHMLGVIDNYALLLKSLFGGEGLKSVKKANLNLFKKQYIKALEIEEFAKIFDKYKDWNKKIKEKRDPIAHTIPLSVPPSSLNEEQQVLYNEKNIMLDKARNSLFEAIGNRSNEDIIEEISSELESIEADLSSIGEFRPLFIHDPSEIHVPIYPTVPEDVGNLISLMKELNHEISERI